MGRPDFTRPVERPDDAAMRERAVDVNTTDLTVNSGATGGMSVSESRIGDNSLFAVMGSYTDGDIPAEPRDVEIHVYDVDPSNAADTQVIAHGHVENLPIRPKQRVRDGYKVEYDVRNNDANQIGIRTTLKWFLP